MMSTVASVGRGSIGGRLTYSACELATTRATAWPSSPGSDSTSRQAASAAVTMMVSVRRW